MSETVAAAMLGRVNEREGRGAAIARRMDRLNMTKSELAEKAGVSRSTLYKVLGDHDGAEERSYGKAERALDRAEHEHAEEHGGADAIVSTEQGLIEFEVTGDFGVRVVARAPVENAAELEASVGRLIRDIRRDRETGEN